MDVEIREVCSLITGQASISFNPVGGDLEKIGVDRRVKITLFPEKEKTVEKIIGFLVLAKGHPISREILKQECQRKGWRLATAFELAALLEVLFANNISKEIKHSVEDNLKTVVVALGDSFSGNYVAISKPNWDWSLTLFAPQELNDSFNFAVVKTTELIT